MTGDSRSGPARTGPGGRITFGIFERLAFPVACAEIACAAPMKPNSNQLQLLLSLGGAIAAVALGDLFIRGFGDLNIALRAAIGFLVARLLVMLFIGRRQRS